jgi:ketosteroid isomerase-like protein
MSVEENKRIARLYHDLDTDDIDDILTPDFVGYHPDGSTWDRDTHKKFWLPEEMRSIKDIIHVQIAEGEWVATRFTRAGPYQGKHFELDMMAFKRFQDGKIVEIWEQYDSKQLEE